MRVTLALLLGAVLVLAGCSSEAPGSPALAPSPAPTTIATSLRPPPDQPVRDPRQALALVPEGAEVVTLTDWDAIRERLGFVGVTSDDPVTDRERFWRQAAEQVLLLTDGLLRSENSRLMLDFGFTQDDVDWEARFSGEDASGYVLAFRPDQDMAEVSRAVAAGIGPLSGATVYADQRLLVLGVAEEHERVWAMDPRWLDLTVEPGQSTYLRRDCVPLAEALGPDASADDLEALVDVQDPTYLRPLDAFSVSFLDQVATARLGAGRADLHDRADLAEHWPAVGELAFADGFEGMPVGDPATGRIGLRVGDPLAAARLVLTGVLPFAVCNEVEPIPEPTGL